MKKKNLDLRFGVITLLILLVALSRLVPHPPNFSPVGGMALFGAAYYSKRYMACFISVIAMWISDLAVNNILYAQYFDHFVWFYNGAIFTYGAFLVIVIFGTLILKKIRVKNLIVAALGSSIIFFLISNFGVWLASDMYPKNGGSLMSCYIAGLPFFQNTLFSNLFYCAMLFGIFELSVKNIPQLQAKNVNF